MNAYRTLEEQKKARKQKGCGKPETGQGTVMSNERPKSEPLGALTEMWVEQIK